MTKTEEVDPGSRAEGEGAGEGSTRAVPLLALDAAALVTWFSGVLASRAWVDMGLLTNPATGKVSKRPDSARLAIDAFEALATTLRSRVSPQDIRAMEATLTDLRLNFVRQTRETVGESGTGKPAGPEREPSGGEEKPSGDQEKRKVEGGGE